MRNFSLIGVGPQTPQMVMTGSVESRKPPGYIGSKRGQQRTAPQGQEPVRARFKGQPHPPLKPVVVLAKKKDNELFRFIVGKVGITPKTSPAEAVEVIKCDVIEAGLTARDARLHRCSHTSHAIHLVLKTQAGYSRFEGTPAQLLATFTPLS